MTRRQPNAENIRGLLKREFISIEQGIEKVISSEIYLALNNLEHHEDLNQIIKSLRKYIQVDN